ncbi:uncharacterized protein LOC112346273 [Selaginella moellendorffii]|uniref:uncharacterized protein LOC112346273 n=1 Tax=Selaginella moellendorffii TaxID=88036 RepID=UPI000D1CBD57|nr:uncharacterized protein LOC112346273 [Selaginella moellendorffii]|eukprot:XP_024530638.1 uncharacterized protein LOC112346273 [Selaginella moellendorffii]
MAMANDGGGTVVFASVGRSHYAFDAFALDIATLKEEVLTDGVSVNFNAQFVEDDPVSLELLCEHDPMPNYHQEEKPSAVIFVSERTGASNIFLRRQSITSKSDRDDHSSTLKLGSLDAGDGFLYCDRPCVAGGGRIIFASTKGSPEISQNLRQPSTAIFSACLRIGLTRRLTPEGVADYSPALSPSKKWIAVASNAGKPWNGEIHELETSLWIFKAEDGSSRKMVVERGGWPTWSDERTIFFHKRSPEDDWWSIYKAVLPESLEDLDAAKIDQAVERVTPPGVHAFTPAASRTSNWIVVATHRSNTTSRHIELFDLSKGSFLPVTLELHPELHHFNPFVSATSDTLIGYHRCRNDGSIVPTLEHVACPANNDITLVRIDGAFPSISSDGALIAYNTDFEASDSGVMVAKLDGSNRKRILTGLAFTTCWNPCKPGTIYTSVGHIFAEERAMVHIVSLTFDVTALEDHSSSSSSTLESSVKVLSKPGTNNNAFPSCSPDGKNLVFRSGRSGHKNLYIMDAELGEDGGIRALTEGPWVDTMPCWSPDGNWIAFSSSRDGPSNEFFAIYLVHPDGSELHRVFPESSTRGRCNHVCFSPDSQTLLFTADCGGISAEPVSLANQFQPYGELFSCKLDGSELRRWTHNAYEDGTPCWGPLRLDPSSISKQGQELHANFQDCLWLSAVTEKMKQYAAA